MSDSDFERRLDDLRAQARANGGVFARGVAVVGGPIPPGTRNPLRGASENAAGRAGYYGMPALKPPVWTWEIPVYFFVGGLSGMSAIIALIAWFYGQIDLARAAIWTTAVGGGFISPALLIADLGRPKMFLNMLRIVKLQSAMSMGAWILSTLGAAAVPAALAVELHHWRLLPGAWQTALGYVCDLLLLASAPLGGLLATYTGVLIGATAIPAWFKHRSMLPLHFGVAGLGSAAGWLLALGWRTPALRVVSLTAAAIETALWLWLMFRKHGAADRAVRVGASGWMLHAAEVLTGPAALTLALLGWPTSGAIFFMAGSLLSRFGWLAAGRASGRDPEAAFASQS